MPHINMLVTLPPKMSVSGFMGYLKDKNVTIIFQKWGSIKFAYRNREFWCKDYYVDKIGKDAKVIKEYIANQLNADRQTDQLSIKNLILPLFFLLACWLFSHRSNQTSRDKNFLHGSSRATSLGYFSSFNQKFLSFYIQQTPIK